MSQCKRERVNVDGHVLFCVRDDGHVGLHVDVGGFAWGSELSERETVAAIVAWLRSFADPNKSADGYGAINCAADAIERGEWK